MIERKDITDFIEHIENTTLITRFFENAHNHFKVAYEEAQEEFENRCNGVLSDKIKSLRLIGTLQFNPDEADNLIVFSCEFDGVLNERSARKAQHEVAKQVLAVDYNSAGIFIVYDKQGHFRFSFIRRNWGAKGRDKHTPFRRYTFFVDPEQTNKTFIERMLGCNFKNLDAIQEAFSVERLTKDFYNDLFKWYQWTLSEELGVTFPNNVNINEDDREKLEVQIIRLITRTLFVWFIKQKQLVPDHLFDEQHLTANILKDFEAHSKAQGIYYNAILQNLFFATLNEQVATRQFRVKSNTIDVKTRYRYEDMFAISEEEIIKLFERVPFLNGGLFECLDKREKTDGVEYNLDGFSKNDTKRKGHYTHRAFIPNCVFFGDGVNEGLLPLLKRYNFTVEESSVSEQQVALDPELLGNVFENLLGAFNPETKESARKQSGSFYTPKEIVGYMVDESLKVHLKGRFAGQEAVINELFAAEEGLPEALLADTGLSEAIDKELRAMKILDPACGSGAFPMGILNRMVNLLERLNPTHSHYDLKLHLIEECIYGIDIQTIAIQISKLRFFISLIVEQEADYSKDVENYGIIPLPNLETKFVAANTLMRLKKERSAQLKLDFFNDEVIEQKKLALLKIRRDHFYAKTRGRKEQLREEDHQLCKEISDLLLENKTYNEEETLKLLAWNPYDQNMSAPFFDPEWMFGLTAVDGGFFDVVIGNPPYVQLQKIKEVSITLQGGGFETFARTGDIYVLFYEKGYDLLKGKGLLCFITSNKWMRAGYGEALRGFFVKHTEPLQLVDFGGVQVFESATVDTNILLFAKTAKRKAAEPFKTLACTVKDKELKNLSDYVRQHATLCHFDNVESWVILSEIEQRIKQKIEAVGTPLKDWDINIYRGILTGYNEAFIIDKTKRDELIAQDPKSIEIIRPFLRGRDIKRYSYEFAELYIITTFPSLKIDIEEYPAIKEHLMSFGYDRLKQTGDKGARKKTNNKWFETQDSISYWEEFSKQKIAWASVGATEYSLVEKNIFLLDTNYFFTTERPYYLLALLNSKLITYWINSEDTPIGNGGAYRHYKYNLEKLPLVKIKENTIKEFKMLIEQKRYQEIDKIVYNAYNINEEEVKYIEEQAN